MRADDFSKIIRQINNLNLKANSKVVELMSINVNEIEDTKVIEDVRVALSNLQSEIDRFLKIDFYHIMSMTNLSGAQILLIVKAVKNLGKAEDHVKRGISITNGMKMIVSSLHSVSTYKCSSSLDLSITSESSMKLLRDK